MHLCSLIVLGLKHFEGTIQMDQLISSYLLCKSRWNFRKHIREMSGPRAPHGNLIKVTSAQRSRAHRGRAHRGGANVFSSFQTFLTSRVAPQLPLACSRVQPRDRCPPVDRTTINMPNWLKVRCINI